MLSHIIPLLTTKIYDYDLSTTGFVYYQREIHLLMTFQY